MRHNFFAIGHISNDLNPIPHLGGGVSYSGITAKKLGYDVSVLTKAPPEHKYLKQLRNLGLKCISLPIRNDAYRQHITSFILNYDTYGKRKIFAKEIQEEIILADIRNITIPNKSTILISAVANEINYDLIPCLSFRRSLYISLQGFFRTMKQVEIINAKPGKEKQFLRTVTKAEAVFLSDEDVNFKGKADTEFLEKIKQVCKTVVFTQGEKGLTIFNNEEKPIRISAFKLSKDEVADLTGAGDCCAGSFIWYYQKTKSLKEAGVFSCFYSALKIIDIGGKQTGVDSIPDLQEVKTFIRKNKKRYQKFLKNNKVSSLAI